MKSQDAPLPTRLDKHRPRWTVAVLLLLAVANFIAFTLAETTRWHPWSNPDAEHYLHIARRIRAGKGFTSRGPEQFHADQWMAQHPETARQPLFPYLLSLLAGPDEGFIVRARLLNIGLSVALLAGLFLVGRVLMGERVAVVAVVLFSLLDGLISLGGEAMVGPLLAIWFMLFFFVAVNLNKGVRYWLAGGVFAALAWLTKGTGLLLIPAFIGVALISRLSPMRTMAAVGLVVTSFLLVSSPLIARNICYFGDPFYNKNTCHAIWTDGFAVVGGGWTMLYTDSTTPTLSRYLATHSVLDIAKRAVSGLIGTTYSLVKACALRIPKLHLWVRAVVGAPLLTLGLIGLIRERRREPATLMWSLLAMFGVSLAWFCVIGGGQRVWFPLVPLLFLCAGTTLVRIWDRVLSRQLTWVTPPVAVIVFAVVVAVGQAYAWRNVSRSPFVPPPLSLTTRLAHHWQMAHIAETDIVFGRDIDRTETFVPNYANFTEFQQAARRFEVRYLVLDTDSFAARRHIFAQYIKAEGERLVLRRLLPGWELAYQTPPEAPESEPHYLIFEGWSGARASRR